MHSYSQHNIDLYLLNLFKDQKDGFFIEAGAHNGIDQNNTFLLETNLKWKGLLVEPNPHTFIQCAKNRSCIVENYALVAFDFLGEEVNGDFFQTSFEGSMMGGCAHVHHKNDKVKAIQISKLLDKHQVKKIDFFSIDVEGYEIEVLNGLDFQRHRPSYILYENHVFRDIKYQESHEEFLSKRNYEPINFFTQNHILYRSKI
jgi:FkbM family methyltransferase